MDCGATRQSGHKSSESERTAEYVFRERQKPERSWQSVERQGRGSDNSDLSTGGGRPFTISVDTAVAVAAVATNTAATNAATNAATLERVITTTLTTATGTTIRTTGATIRKTGITTTTIRAQQQ